MIKIWMYKIVLELVLILLWASGASPDDVARSDALDRRYHERWSE